MNRTEKEEFIIGSISLLSNKITLFGDSIFPDITFKQWFLLMMISKMELQDKTKCQKNAGAIGKQGICDDWKIQERCEGFKS